jgi:hypothetical protein
MASANRSIDRESSCRSLTAIFCSGRVFPSCKLIRAASEEADTTRISTEKSDDSFRVAARTAVQMASPFSPSGSLSAPLTMQAGDSSVDPAIAQAFPPIDPAIATASNSLILRTKLPVL